MIPAITAVRMSGGGRDELPLLVLGPSLGTSAAALWSHCATGLIEDFDVVAWDLPGHGHNRSVPEDDITVADLAAGVLAVVDDILDQRGEHDGSFFVAGDSVGGAVALQLALDAPSRVRSAAALCAGARFATPGSWLDRIELVATSGTSALTSTLPQRWFSPGFVERAPKVVSTLQHDVHGTDDDGYISVCRALASYDASSRLGEITTPLLVIAGADDQTAPPSRELADGVPGSRFVELPGVGHLAPEEAPDEVAQLLREHFIGAGHVDRATADATELTRDFPEFITEYASGGNWARPGLDRRTRSLVTLAALVARSDHEELAAHLRAAIVHGVTRGEIKEMLLQTAVHCGVTDANAAFRIALEVFDEA